MSYVVRYGLEVDCVKTRLEDAEKRAQELKEQGHEGVTITWRRSYGAAPLRVPVEEEKTTRRLRPSARAVP